jgi:hypothetical protein
VFREGLRPPDPFRARPVLETACTQDGMSLGALAAMSPVLVVCLPDVGGRGGRRMLRELAAARGGIERAGVRVVLVHFDEVGDALAPLDLQYVARIRDPERGLYAHFGLGMAPRGLLRREAQEAGAFLVHKGEVVREARGEAPDYRLVAGI